MTRHTWSTDGGIHEIPLPDGVPGRLHLCGKHHIAPDVHAVLERTGATTVVCLTQRHELEGRYPRYVDWLTENASGAAIWFPVHDLSAPLVEPARVLFGDLARRLVAGEGLVVHCAAGIGRAGTTAIGVLMQLGMPLDEARLHVRAHRPMAGPEAGSQLELLRTLAESAPGSSPR
jgi:protein-tyrosine phosphatase